MKKLLLLVLAACTAMAIAECANSLYVRFDQDFYLRPGYGWDIQGGSIRINAMSPGWQRYFNDLGNTVFVLVRQDSSSIYGDYVGDAFVKDINGDFESSVVRTTEPVSYYCEEGAQQSLSFEYEEKTITIGGSELTANFVKISDPRPYAFGMDGKIAVNEVYVLGKAAGGFKEADLFFETPEGWVKADENAFIYLGCCEPECTETAGGCESIVAAAEGECSGNWLYSYSCVEGACAPEAMECENGCVDNECAFIASCTDSDKGALGSTKGIVSTMNAQGNSSEFEDYCASGYTLVEYYCSGLTAKSKEMTCEYGCFEGACAAAPIASQAAEPSQGAAELPLESEGGDYGFYAAALGMIVLLGGIAYWLYRGGK